VASGLVSLLSVQVVQVPALVDRDILLCCEEIHFKCIKSFSTQVYKFVPVNLMLGVTLQWTSIPSRGE